MMIPAALWSLAKAGVAIPFGPIHLRLNLCKSTRVSFNPHRGLSRWLRLVFRSDRPGSGERPEPRHWNTPLRAPECRDRIAVIVGVGPGFGSSLARRLAQAGMRIVLATRNTEKLWSLLDDVHELGGEGYPFACDASDERSVRDLFAYSERELGCPDLVIFNLEHYSPGEVVQIDTSAFEECWRANCLSAFLVGRAAARSMQTQGRGTIIFTGITASLRGNGGFLNLAVGKFGVRALAQCMARELGPKGIHVVHTVLDSGMLSEQSSDRHKEQMTAMHPNQLAETYFHLYTQHPSAWTHEIDLRPWAEAF